MSFNLHKYSNVYEQKCAQTGHLTALWTENVSKHKTELKSVYLTW